MSLSSSDFLKALDCINKGGTVVFPKRVQLDNTDLVLHNICSYCGRSWNYKKHESCPSCGAPPEAGQHGIRTMKIVEGN